MAHHILPKILVHCFFLCERKNICPVFVGRMDIFICGLICYCYQLTAYCPNFNYSELPSYIEDIYIEDLHIGNKYELFSLSEETVTPIPSNAVTKGKTEDRIHIFSTKRMKMDETVTNKMTTESQSSEIETVTISKNMITKRMEMDETVTNKMATESENMEMLATSSATPARKKMDKVTVFPAASKNIETLTTDKLSAATKKNDKMYMFSTVSHNMEIMETVTISETQKENLINKEHMNDTDIKPSINVPSFLDYKGINKSKTIKIILSTLLLIVVLLLSVILYVKKCRRVQTDHHQIELSVFDQSSDDMGSLDDGPMQIQNSEADDSQSQHSVQLEMHQISTTSV